MKRLEHIRTMRNQMSRFQAKNPHGAMMVLAQIAQEKQRLEQERGTWESRIQKIEKRLKEIAEMEQRLFAVARTGSMVVSCQRAQGGELADLAAGLPPGFTEVTVKY